MLPLALFAAYEMTGDRATLRVARESLEFLEDVCFDGDRLQLVGNTGWHSRGGEKACADEQAIDAAAFVLAFRCAYKVTPDRHYLRRMREVVRVVPRRQPAWRAVVRLRHGRLPRRHGRGARQSEPRRREHDLLLAVAAQDARARGRGARTRRRASRWLPNRHDVPCRSRVLAIASCPTPAACSPSPTCLARRRCCRPVACTPADGRGSWRFRRPKWQR